MRDVYAERLSHKRALDGLARNLGTLVDAGLSILACAVLTPLALRWNRLERTAAPKFRPLPV